MPEPVVVGGSNAPAARLRLVLGIQQNNLVSPARFNSEQAAQLAGMSHCSRVCILVQCTTAPPLPPNPYTLSPSRCRSAACFADGSFTRWRPIPPLTRWCCCFGDRLSFVCCCRSSRARFSFIVGAKAASTWSSSMHLTRGGAREVAGPSAAVLESRRRLWTSLSRWAGVDFA